MANEFIIKNGYFSQGNSNVTGSVAITQDVTASKSLFSSSNGDQLTVIGSGSTIAQVYGSQGNLLTVNDTFSGSIFTVTDISGYPILDVTSDYYTSSINTIGFLNHTGSARVTGSLVVSGGFEVYDTINELKNINSDSRSLYDAGGADSIQWDQRRLTDGTADALSWQYRILYYTDGTTKAIDWATTDQILISGSVIPAGPYVSNTSSYNLGSPTAAWNEIYVSNNSLYLVSGSVSASIGFNGGFISFISAGLSLPTLTTSSQQYVVTYNSESGQLFYTASSAIGGGTFNSTSSIIGDDVNTTYTITHNFNTKNLHITVYETSSNGETVYPDIRRNGLNTTQIVFSNPPRSGSYIVYISQ
jgi:hypothetical protein